MNGDSKLTTGEINRTAKGDINQNDALGNSTSAQDTSNLSESTIQAFRETLHYKPLSQSSLHDNATDQMNNVNNDQNAARNHGPNKVAESNIHNDCVGGSDHELLDNRALFQGISLKDFEKHHKLMKEANIEKRRVLSTAIEQRYGMNIQIKTTI